jgi:uncharacterized protein YacL
MSERVYSANGIVVAMVCWIIGTVVLLGMFGNNQIIALLSIIGFFVLPLLAADYDFKREQELNK